MKYNSVPEYFVKLYNRLYAIVLLPLITFAVLYWYANLPDTEPVLRDEVFNRILLLGFSMVVLIDWLVSFFLFKSGLKSILTIGSLGERLDRYYTLSMVRFLINVSGLFILVIGFYLTEDQYFSLLFAGSLLSLAFFWPTSAKVCEDLNLKGEERRLILYKLDKLS